jgi:diketogulonate reductase-like aldo/keto reductase
MAVGMGTAGGRQREVIQANIAHGVRHIDTAQGYGSDSIVGTTLAQLPVSRSELFITSKVNGCASDSSTDYGLPGGSPAKCASQTKAQIQTNLAHLRVSYVDLMLIHFPPMPDGCASSAGCAVYRAQWQVLVEAYDEGLARAIGLSNACTTCYDCLLPSAKVKPHVNQLNFQAGIGAGGEAIRAQSSANGIVLESYAGHRNGALELPSVVRAAERSGVSSSRVAMRWLAQQGIAYVSTSTNTDHVSDNLLALAAPVLTAEEMDAIRDDPKGGKGGGARWPNVMRPCGT